MSILPKKHFSWKEPPPVIAMLEAQRRAPRRWWHAPLTALVSVALILLLWYVGPLRPNAPQPAFQTMVLLAIGFGILPGWIVPWLYSQVTPTVTVYNRRLIRFWQNQGAIRFKDLTTFAWDTEAGYPTLILHRRRGQPIVIGVPPEISPDALTRFLFARLPGGSPPPPPVGL